MPSAVLPQFFLVLIHVLAAATSLGATVTYAVAIAVAERSPEHLPFTIGAVRRSDRMLAIPAYLIAFVTGLALTFTEHVPLDRFWIAASILIYLVVLIVGFTVFGPVVRQELAALARSGTADPEYPRLRRQAALLSFGTIAALVVIFALMIAKPNA